MCGEYVIPFCKREWEKRAVCPCDGDTNNVRKCGIAMEFVRIILLPVVDLAT
jgi:hypothetical protein